MATKEELLAAELRNQEKLRRIQENRFVLKNGGDNPMLSVPYQIEVANMAGPGVDVDPTMARYQPEHGGLNIQGFMVDKETSPENMEYLRNRYRYSDGPNNKMVFIPVEKNTVNVLGAENNNPETWSHEYRHQDVKSENMSRLIDAAQAKTKKQWESAISFWQDTRPEGTSMAQAEQSLLDTLDANRDWSSSIKSTVKDDQQPLWQRRFMEKELLKRMEKKDK
jgi:hypothetical protein